MHKNFEEIQNIRQQRNIGIIIDNGQILIVIEDELRRRKEYLIELFKYSVRTPPEIRNMYNEEITDEVKRAIKWLKDGEAPEPDDVHGGILKLLENLQMTDFTKLLDNIYETMFIPISKTSHNPTLENARNTEWLS